MKALAIIGLVFGSLSIFIPVGGIYIAMLCSVLAMISFRTEPTLSGITLGINIINTAFLSPSLMISDAASSGVFDKANSISTNATELGDVYWSYVGFHLVVLVIAGIYRFFKGTPELKGQLSK